MRGLVFGLLARRPIGAGCIAACMSLGSCPAWAQDRLLKESEVTEQALVQALAPPAAVPGSSSADAGTVTRGFQLAAVRPRRQSILITFDTDSAELLPRTRSMLDVVAKALDSDRLSGLNIVIEGHADPRGGEEHNLRLSQARADHVVSYLVAQRGIAADRLKAVGKGSTELLNRADPTAAENRRVSIVARPQ